MFGLGCRAGAGPVLSTEGHNMTIELSVSQRVLIIEASRGWAFLRIGRREWCIERNPMTGRWASLSGEWLA